MRFPVNNRRLARARRPLLASAFALLLLLAAWPVIAADQPAQGAADQRVATNILAHIYQAGYARLARGDVAGAVSVFRLVHSVASELPEADYALATALTLSDFANREQALPFIAEGDAVQSGNPIGAILGVFADARFSTLRPDGALYLTAAGAQRLRAAAAQLPQTGDIKYLAVFIDSMESTGDPAFPQRYPDFSRMIGQNGVVRLKAWTGEAPFGQLFSVSVPVARFSPYEARLIERLQNGLNSLEQNQESLSRVRDRIQQLRSELQSNDPAKRVVALADLDKLLSHLDDIIASNETTIASLKVIVDNVGVDQELQRKKAEVKQQEIQLVALKNTGKALTAELSQKKADLSQAEAQLIKKQEEVNTAQKQLNELQKRLADAKTRLQASSQTTAQTEAAVKQHDQQLADIAAQEAALQKKQEAAAQLDSLKQQQAAAAAQLKDLRAQIQQAQSSPQGDLTAMHKQESDLSAKVAALQKSVSDGEVARQQADQLRQQLTALQSQKSSVEGELASEHADLARLQAEREGLEREVAAMQRARDAALAESARQAQYAKEVDFGRYFALVIGNDDYQEWPKLKTAANDARAIATLLQNKYGFTVKLLLNAKRTDIINAFNDYDDQLSPNDNLLIYYAGHGITDQAGNGYWVPVDGDAYVKGSALRTGNLVGNDDVISAIQKLHAKQVMVVADSCFSGDLAQLASTTPAASRLPREDLQPIRGFRLVDQSNTPAGQVLGMVAETDQPEELVAMKHWASRAARVVLTSGGNEPVVDQLRPTDTHSVFAEALLNALSSNRTILKSIALVNTVQDQVVGQVGGSLQRAGRGNAAPVEVQTPNYSNLGGYDGEFLFVTRG
jgi:hypothetical protein